MLENEKKEDLEAEAVPYHISFRTSNVANCDVDAVTVRQ